MFWVFEDAHPENAAACFFLQFNCSAEMNALRSWKIADIAVFDVAATLAIACLVARRSDRRRPRYAAFCIGAILLGVLVHHLFGVRTKLNYYLGISGPPPRPAPPSFSPRI